jgi:hypothetical protein
LHPPEPSLIRSKRHAEAMVRLAGFWLVAYDFKFADLFTYAVLILEKDR